uniref:Uncharacterized protein n=1 Tax=Arundo donax TaxID=35708 RepID=A0A0A9DB16_ARUDO
MVLHLAFNLQCGKSNTDCPNFDQEQHNSSTQFVHTLQQDLVVMPKILHHPVLGSFTFPIQNLGVDAPPWAC